MSYTAHDAVLVTMSLDLDGHPDVHLFKRSMPPEYRRLVQGPFPGVINNYLTWVFVPDCSYEGRPESDAADEWRRRFIALWPPTGRRWSTCGSGATSGKTTARSSPKPRLAPDGLLRVGPGLRAGGVLGDR